MTLDEKRHAYQAFFDKNDAGKGFISEIHAIIDRCHREGEKDADHSRDLAQQAKGARRVLEHIQSITAEREQRLTRKS